MSANFDLQLSASEMMHEVSASNRSKSDALLLALTKAEFEYSKSMAMLKKVHAKLIPFIQKAQNRINDRPNPSSGIV